MNYPQADKLGKCSDHIGFWHHIGTDVVEEVFRGTGTVYIAKVATLFLDGSLDAILDNPIEQLPFCSVRKVKLARHPGCVTDAQIARAMEISGYVRMIETEQGLIRADSIPADLFEVF